MNIPYNIIFIHPLWDIVIITVLVFVALYAFFYFLFNKETEKMLKADLKVFIVLLLLFYLNYKGQSFDISSWGIFELREIWWFWYFLIIYFLVELPLYVLLSKKIGFSPKDIDMAMNKKMLSYNVRKQEQLIRELESAMNFLESDKLSIQESGWDDDQKKEKILEIEEERKKLEKYLQEAQEELDEIKESNKY